MVLQTILSSHSSTTSLFSRAPSFPQRSMAASPRISPTKSIRTFKIAESIHPFHFIVVGIAHPQAAHSHRRHRSRLKLVACVFLSIRHVRSSFLPSSSSACLSLLRLSLRRKPESNRARSVSICKSNTDSPVEPIAI